ncbi:retrovirus-related pol polyprotein from transposon TNT 1-94 [Tanacetum coccineum]
MASKQFKDSTSSSLNNDVQQSSEEVEVPSLNTQSVSNNMVPNVDEASTSHNVFNERLEDAYFDASMTFHDSSNIHTFYQPYPHMKKWTKDHPLHKIIGDPKSSFRTRGQIENSCLFSCLLSIEPANVAEALKDVDWVSAMQEELDQFSRLKVWRLVPRPKGKTIINTKWIFKNKKDESSLVIRNKARLISDGFSRDTTVRPPGLRSAPSAVHRPSIRSPPVHSGRHSAIKDILALRIDDDDSEKSTSVLLLGRSQSVSNKSQVASALMRLRTYTSRASLRDLHCAGPRCPGAESSSHHVHESATIEQQYV